MVAAHAGAGACAAMAVGTWTGWLLGVALFALGLAAARSRALLSSPKSLRVLQLGGEEALVELADGTRIQVRIAPRRYVTSRVVALSIIAPARRTVLITAGMLDADDFRRLRLWALWGRLPRREEAAPPCVASQQPSA